MLVLFLTELVFLNFLIWFSRLFFFFFFDMWNDECQGEKITSMATKINYKILKLLLHDHLWDCRSDSAFRSQGELTVACKCHWCGRQLRGSKTSWKHSFRSIVRTETLSLHVLDCMWHRSQSSSLSLFSLHLTIKHLSIRCLQLIRQVLCH